MIEHLFDSVNVVAASSLIRRTRRHEFVTTTHKNRSDPTWRQTWRAMTSRAQADDTVRDHGCDHTRSRSVRRTRRGAVRLSPGYGDRTLAPLEDAELLARVVDRDRRAIEVLYERHAGWLQVRLERRCGNPDLADLALQDTFLSVWKTASKWRGDGEVAAWLWGIAVRRLVDHIRSAGRRVDTRSIDTADPTTQLTDEAPTPEETVVDDRPDADLADALADLPPELLEVIVATTVDGLTNREAADLLGIPVGTLKTRARKARGLLQSAIPHAAPEGATR